ncbi:ABC transporter permease subunit [Actinomadura sp. KC06]|uniref:amino acid ABC transporter permease n=1 Tax=Actinomadura sp. KC06 TaxID=2530369 RepID=UPI001404CA2D|nr:ABC transporter permease subunit [Actinomadura sp. KC06]
MTFLAEHLDDYLRGLWLTVRLTCVVCTAAFLLALLLATARASPVPSLRGFAASYVGVFRNIPELAILLILTSGIPKVGLTTSYFVFAVAGFTLYHSAFTAEILRSGLRAVPAGQVEAARALGLGFGRTAGHIVLPLALRAALPALANQAIAVLKGTAIASAVGLADLTHVADEIAVEEARPVLAFGVAVVGYLLLTIPLGLLIMRLENRLATI